LQFSDKLLQISDKGASYFAIADQRTAFSSKVSRGHFQSENMSAIHSTQVQQLQTRITTNILPIPQLQHSTL